MQCTRCGRRAWPAIPWILLLLLGIREGQATVWEQSLIAASRAVAAPSCRSLVLNSKGQPCVAYGGSVLSYAHHDGKQWRRETVDPGPDIGAYVSLDLGKADSPCLAYVGNGKIRCAQWVQNLLPPTWYWRLEAVDDGCAVGNVVVDEDYHLHLLYIKGGWDHPEAWELRYAQRDASGWHVENVVSGGGFQSRPALALDHQGRPHVALVRAPGIANGKVIYAARQESGVWKETIVGTAGDAESYPSLVLDAADRPHILFGRNNKQAEPFTAVFHAFYDGTEWRNEPVLGEEQEKTVGAYMSAVAFGTEEVRFAYYLPWTKELLYVAVSGNQVLALERIQQGTVCESASLAFTASGEPTVAFLDATLGEMRYASRNGETWHVERIDGGEAPGEDVAIQVEARGGPQVCWIDGQAAELRYAVLEGTNWTTTVVDPARKFCALALGTQGLPRMAYLSADTNQLRYAALVRWRDVPVEYWDRETVDVGGVTGPSLAVNSAGWPGISYVKDGVVKYGYKDEGGWHSMSVDETGGASAFVKTSLALGPGDLPRIVFLRRHPDDSTTLVYASSRRIHFELFWSLENVAHVSANSFQVFGANLVLTSDGWPRIHYWGYGDDAIRLLSQDAAGWHEVSVYPGLPMCDGAACAIDPWGQVHLLSDCDDVESSKLRHAVATGSIDKLTWRDELIKTGSMSYPLGLAVGADGTIHGVHRWWEGKYALWYERGTPLRFTNVQSLASGLFQFRWEGETNALQVWRCLDLGKGEWTRVTEEAVRTNGIELQGTHAAAFYRLMKESPR